MKDFLNKDENDVVILSEESGDEGKDGNDGSYPNWATQVEDTEKDWVVCFPNADPYVFSKLEHTEDGWYQGEDCVMPPEAANIQYCQPRMGL